MSLRAGVVYPQTELAGDPEAARRIGAAAEALGYDHLLAYDHVVGAVRGGRTEQLWGPYDEHDPFHDPFVLFAYLAGRTSRLKFATGVLVLPQRQTALVARQAADLAILSGNRLRLGVGIGWNPVEYAALRQDFRTRGARLGEQVELLRRLWREPVVDYRGRFDSVDRVGCMPRPHHEIPVWLGGWADAALARAARIADGFIFAGGDDTVLERWLTLRAMLAAQGRPADQFGAQAVTHSVLDPRDVAGFARRWAAAGGTHLGINSMGLGLRSVQDHLDYFAAAAETLAGAGLTSGY